MGGRFPFACVFSRRRARRRRPSCLPSANAMAHIVARVSPPALCHCDHTALSSLPALNIKDAAHTPPMARIQRGEAHGAPTLAGAPRHNLPNARVNAKPNNSQNK